MNLKKLFVTAALALGLGVGAVAGISANKGALEADAAQKANDYSYEIRFVRPSDWGDNAVCIHTWNGITDTEWPGYEMTWLWNNELGQAVYSWTPSASHPLNDKVKFNNNNHGMETSELNFSGLTAGIHMYYYDEGWQHSTVSKMKVYLYDYDSKFDGQTVYAHGTRNLADGLTFDDGTGVAMTAETALSGNGIIYSAEVSNAVDRITFQNSGKTISTGVTSGVGGDMCYVYAPDSSALAGRNTWWGNMNYIYAHNWNMNLLNFRNVSAAAGEGADGVGCEALYEDARDLYNYFKANRAGVLTEIKNSFNEGLLRMKAWATHNHEVFTIEDGIGTFSSANHLSQFVNNNGNTLLVVAGVSIVAVLAASGLFFVRKKKNQF